LTLYLDAAFQCFGPERLMIGPDWPVCTVAATYSEAVEVVKNFLNQYPSEARYAVLDGNGARFWKLAG